MHGLEAIIAMNQSNTAGSLSYINLDRGADPNVGAQAKMAMATLDKWLADAERKLVGREVVRTGDDDPLYGAVSPITGVVVAWGASGHHLFVTAPVPQTDDDLQYAREGGAEDLRRHRERCQSSHRLLELGVTCEILAADDTPGDH